MIKNKVNCKTRGGDLGHTKFSKRLDNIPAEIITKIAKIDELKGRWITVWGGSGLELWIWHGINYHVIPRALCHFSQGEAYGGLMRVY